MAHLHLKYSLQLATFLKVLKSVMRSFFSGHRVLSTEDSCFCKYIAGVQLIVPWKRSRLILTKEYLKDFESTAQVREVSEGLNF